MKIKYGGKPQGSPVKKLDDWIESHNCKIERYMAWDGYSESLMVAVNLLSEVVDFFNGENPGALAQSGRADDR